MVLHVTLTFIRWTVALTAWVVITNASWVFSRVVGLAVVLNGMGHICNFSLNTP